MNKEEKYIFRVPRFSIQGIVHWDGFDWMLTVGKDYAYLDNYYRDHYSQYCFPLTTIHKIFYKI